MNRRARQGGFTLIEVITVVVILAITAVISSQFIVNAVRLHHINQTRADLINTSRQAIERMTRQLRGAVPYAVRLTDGDNCVQFFPIAGGGHYQGSVMDGDPVTVGPHSSDDFGDAAHLTLGVLSPGEAYGGGSARIAYTGNAANDINGHAWPRDSFSSRFYLADDPQAFCVNNGQLVFFDDLDPGLGDVLSQGTSDLLANNVQAGGAPFAVLYDGVEHNLNLRVVINLSFFSGGEGVDYNQEVMLRNVP